MAWTCPDDGIELGEPSGAAVCIRCRGEAFEEARFETAFPGIRSTLHEDPDADSGAFARPRPCPSCRRVMAPLQIERQLAWIESCEACGLLWVERLDVPVLQGLIKRRTRDLKMAAIPIEERQEIASALASVEVERHKDERTISEAKGFLRSLFGRFFIS